MTAKTELQHLRHLVRVERERYAVLSNAVDVLLELNSRGFNNQHAMFLNQIDMIRQIRSGEIKRTSDAS